MPNAVISYVCSPNDDMALPISYVYSLISLTPHELFNSIQYFQNEEESCVVLQKCHSFCYKSRKFIKFFSWLDNEIKKIINYIN